MKTFPVNLVSEFLVTPPFVLGYFFLFAVYLGGAFRCLSIHQHFDSWTLANVPTVLRAIKFDRNLCLACK